MKWRIWLHDDEREESGPCKAKSFAIPDCSLQIQKGKRPLPSNVIIGTAKDDQEIAFGSRHTVSLRNVINDK